MVRFRKLVWGLAAAATLLAPVAAQAHVQATVDNLLDQVALIAHPDAVAPTLPQLSDATVMPQTMEAAAALPQIDMPSLPAAMSAQLPQPTVENPLHRLFCVEYARLRSGFNIVGDA